MTSPPILVTGATGYIGDRLVRALEQDGRRVRCMARRPESVIDRVASETEVVAGDVFDSVTLEAALEGVHTAYYLIHSMGAKEGFEERDRTGYCP